MLSDELRLRRCRAAGRVAADPLRDRPTASGTAPSAPRKPPRPGGSVGSAGGARRQIVGRLRLPRARLDRRHPADPRDRDDRHARRSRTRSPAARTLISAAVAAAKLLETGELEARLAVLELALGSAHDDRVAIRPTVGCSADDDRRRPSGGQARGRPPPPRGGARLAGRGPAVSRASRTTSARSPSSRSRRHR